MISSILTYLYAVMVVFAACYQMFGQKEKMPIWLFLLNLGSGVCLALKPLNNFWLYGGLLFVLAVAVLNGHEIFGKIRPSHFLFRLIFSLVLALLAFKNF